MESISILNKTQLIPLYIGITGHRNIREMDKPKLKQNVEDFFESSKKQCPNTPLVLLTPLAEGSDRIAAFAALDCNIDFIAVLPMPIADYKDDFETSDSNGEFDFLIKKASSIIEFPLPEGITSESVKNSEIRNEQYYQNGLFIARQCYSLVAMWDGIDLKLKGGTSDVVRLKKTGIPGNSDDNSKKLLHLQTGPIFQIITPRQNNENIPKNALTVNEDYPDHFGNNIDAAKKSEKIFLEHIDNYNHNVLKHSVKLKESIDISKNYLFQEYSAYIDNKTLQNIAEKHAIASELATFFQKKRFFALKTLFVLVVLAFFFIQFYAEFIHKPIILALYPITMGFVVLLYFIAKKGKIENKHQDYRALSEAFRVQFYLKACNLKDNVSDHYLKRHRGELEWVLYAIRTSNLYDWKINNSSLNKSTNNPFDVYKFIKDNWIVGQLEYFSEKSQSNGKTYRRLEREINFFFIFAIFCACVLFLVSFYENEMAEKWANALHATFAFFTHLSLVISAAIHGYSEKMLFAEHEKNYQQMAQLFGIANSKLNQAIAEKNDDEANDIIAELAQEALLENGNWLIIHRSRPIEIPK